MRTPGAIGAAALLLLMGMAAADSISFHGKTLKDVYIREGAAMYYVQNPADGSVVSVSKSEAQEVAILSDAGRRGALLEAWRAKHEALRGEAAAPAAVNASERAADPPKTSSDSGPVIPRVKMKNVPLRDALKATLRPMNLDYEVHENFIRVAPPEKLRHEPYEPLETRVYQLNNAGAETLPKVVVRNPGGAGAYQSAGPGGYGNYGAQGYGGGVRAMTPGYGAGQNYGRYGRSAQFSNISELFSTIDDRLVGETPAIIGVGGLSYYEGPSRNPGR